MDPIPYLRFWWWRWCRPCRLRSPILLPEGHSFEGLLVGRYAFVWQLVKPFSSHMLHNHILFEEMYRLDLLGTGIDKEDILLGLLPAKDRQVAGSRIKRRIAMTKKGKNWPQIHSQHRHLFTKDTCSSQLQSAIITLPLTEGKRTCRNFFRCLEDISHGQGCVQQQPSSNFDSVQDCHWSNQ